MNNMHLLNKGCLVHFFYKSVWGKIGKTHLELISVKINPSNNCFMKNIFDKKYVHIYFLSQTSVYKHRCFSYLC